MMHQPHGNFIHASTFATHILKFAFTLNVMWHMGHIVHCTCCVQSQVKNRKPFFSAGVRQLKWEFNASGHRHTQAIECTLRWHDRSMHHVFRHTKLIISQLSIEWKWQIDSIDQRDIPHLFHVKCIWAAAFLFLFFLRIRLRVCVIENWINYVRC